MKKLNRRLTRVTMETNILMHDFEIGDKVVYNPNMVPLPSAWDRPRDWGRVVKIDSHIHIKLYDSDDTTLRVLPYAVSHSPISRKHPSNVVKRMEEEEAACAAKEAEAVEAACAAKAAEVAEQGKTD